MTEAEYSRNGRIGLIELRGSEPGNRFSPRLRRDVNEALLAYRDDAEAWVAVVSSNGPDFCLGTADEPPSSLSARRERGRLWAGGY
jgi:enoyl-CoA hydratase/carnithine racemase